VTKAEFTRRVNAGEKLPTKVPRLADVRHRNKVTGEEQVLPEGIAPGFGRDPGAKDEVDNYRLLLEKRIARMLKEAEQQDAQP
jgi:hypothetical protein